MKNIDISKVAEIHIAGGEEVEGMVIDTHGTLPSDYSLQYLKENIEQIKGIPICFERDNNVPEFSELVSIQRKLQRRIFN